MSSPERYATLETQLKEALHTELRFVEEASRHLAAAQWHVPSADRAPARRLAIVAADGGNVGLQLAPVRISFVRVASSHQQAPLGELLFSADLDAEPLAELLARRLPALVAPLRQAGIDIARILDLRRTARDRLSVLREVLEWGAVLGQLAERHAEPFLVVRDGLLRSIHLDELTFARLEQAIRDASARTGNRLAAVAKSLPGGGELQNRLLLGGVLDRRPPAELAWLEIPLEVEREVLPASFTFGRRIGPLLLVRVHRAGTFVPIEVTGPPEDAVITLFHPDVAWYPNPGMPIELALAHHHARVSALDRDWLHYLFLDQLAALDPRRARRAITAQVLGAGGLVVSEEPE